MVEFLGASDIHQGPERICLAQNVFRATAAHQRSCKGQHRTHTFLLYRVVEMLHHIPDAGQGACMH